MKKVWFVLLIILMPKFCVAYTQLGNQREGTHYKLTKNAISQSNIKNYLNDYLSIKLDDDRLAGPVLNPLTAGDTPTVREWIQYGGDWEDIGILSARALNHFYDPTTGEGTIGFPNPYWAYSMSDWSWYKARKFYKDALLAINNDARELNFASTFRALGQIAHLLQDMAVPAHTRNDAHYDGNFLWGAIKKRELDMYEQYAAHKIGSLPYAGYDTPSFNKFDDFWHNGYSGTGLADFTNRNFLSRHTNIDDKEYSSPVATGEIIDSIIIFDPQDYQVPVKIVEVKYLSERALDYNLPVGSQVAPIAHLATYSLFDFEMQALNGERVYSLDDECHKDYAGLLIPRAVGYSAGLLNYFFRGTLEISRPARYVYSIADGSLNPQQFIYIKASVKNTSTFNGSIEPMTGGQLWAIAKYKAGGENAYSVSAAIPDVALTTSAQEFEFNFAGNPIPADITDLYLQVVYQGTLGNEEDIAVAVGMKDLNEPTHFGFFNNTDYMYFSGSSQNTFSKPEFILSNTGCQTTTGGVCERPIVCDPVYSGQILLCGTNEDHEMCAYPFNIQVDMSFYPAGYEKQIPPHVTYDYLYGGHYGRVLLLSDAPLKVSLEIDPLNTNSVGEVVFPWIYNGMENFPSNFANFLSMFPGETYDDIDVPVATYQDGAASPDTLLTRGQYFHAFELYRSHFVFDAEIPDGKTEREADKEAAWPVLEDTDVVGFGSINK